MIVDASGTFITTKSSAFLDVGEDAFYDVERLLGSASKGAAPASKAAAPASSASAPPPPPAAMASVGHAELDAEHEAIGALLDEAVATGSPAALRAARDEFRDHATHEEEIMRDAGFGGTGAMSAAGRYQTSWCLSFFVHRVERACP